MSDQGVKWLALAPRHCRAFPLKTDRVAPVYEGVQAQQVGFSLAKKFWKQGASIPGASEWGSDVSCGAPRVVASWKRTGQPGNSRQLWRAVAVATAFVVVAIGSLGWTRGPGEVPVPSRSASTVEPFQTARQQALTRLNACWVFCSTERQSLSRANLALARALEKRAEREHYRQREQVEAKRTFEREAKRLDQIAQSQARAERVAERAHQQRLELLQLRVQREKQIAAARQARQLQYFQALGPEGRQTRLQRCHATALPCDTIVSQLLLAAATDSERTELARTHEQFLAPTDEPLPNASNQAPTTEEQSPTQSVPVAKDTPLRGNLASGA